MDKDITCQGHSCNIVGISVIQCISPIRSSVNLLEILLFWQALHHPFTAPHPEDMKDLSSARALAYDMVYNGVEVCVHIDFPAVIKL